MDHCKTTFCRSMMLPVLFIVLLVFISSISATTLITPIPHDGMAVALRSWHMKEPYPSPTLAERELEYLARAGYNTDLLADHGGEAAARPVEGSEIENPETQEVIVYIGMYDADKLWINGNIITSHGLSVRPFQRAGSKVRDRHGMVQDKSHNGIGSGV
jgi:hypothetical protein